MDTESFFETMPFADMLGIEIRAVSETDATGYVEMKPEFSWNEDRLMAHGGITFTLADIVGSAPFVERQGHPVATIDMRIDYLEVGTGDLRAVSEVTRMGDQIGFVDVDVFAVDDDTRVAEARGAYKT